MNNQPIGVFVSGLGGLTVLKELCAILPNEQMVYFGDTSRVPYGNRSREIILKYARQDIAFLRSHEVKLIVVACGTVSSVLTKDYRNSQDIPLITMIDPAAKAAAQKSRNKRIGVIATAATIGSHGYEKALNALDENIVVKGVACPLLVPIIENGWIAKDNMVARLTVREYLSAFASSDIDTLIMGCTHYPILAPVIQEEIDQLMGRHVTLINLGQEAALYVKNYLNAHAMLTSRQKGDCAYYVSDEPMGFEETASVFLGENLNGKAKRVEIELY